MENTAQANFAQTAITGKGKKGQTLRRAHDSLSLSGQKLFGLSQDIDLSKIDKNLDHQTLTIINSDAKEKPEKILLQVSKRVGGVKKIVSTFAQSADGKIRMITSQDLIESFQRTNPNVKLNIDEDSKGTFSCEINNIKFSQTGISVDEMLNPCEVRAANLNMAVQFSALGTQIMDKDGNRGRVRSSDAALDFEVSTTFIEQALSGNENFVLDQKEPLYSQILVTFMRTKHEFFNKHVNDFANALQLYFAKNHGLQKGLNALKSDILSHLTNDDESWKTQISDQRLLNNFDEFKKQLQPNRDKNGTFNFLYQKTIDGKQHTTNLISVPVHTGTIEPTTNLVRNKQTQFLDFVKKDGVTQVYAHVKNENGNLTRAAMYNLEGLSVVQKINSNNAPNNLFLDVCMSHAGKVFTTRIPLQDEKANETVNALHQIFPEAFEALDRQQKADDVLFELNNVPVYNLAYVQRNAEIFDFNTVSDLQLDEETPFEEAQASAQTMMAEPTIPTEPIEQKEKSKTMGLNVSNNVISKDVSEEMSAYELPLKRESTIFDQETQNMQAQTVQTPTSETQSSQEQAHELPLRRENVVQNETTQQSETKFETAPQQTQQESIREIREEQSSIEQSPQQTFLSRDEKPYEVPLRNNSNETTKIEDEKPSELPLKREATISNEENQNSQEQAHELPLKHENVVSNGTTTQEQEHDFSLHSDEELSVAQVEKVNELPLRSTNKEKMDVTTQLMACMQSPLNDEEKYLGKAISAYSKIYDDEYQQYVKGLSKTQKEQNLPETSTEMQQIKFFSDEYQNSPFFYEKFKSAAAQVVLREKMNGHNIKMPTLDLYKNIVEEKYDQTNTQQQNNEIRNSENNDEFSNNFVKQPEFAYELPLRRNAETQRIVSEDENATNNLLDESPDGNTSSGIAAGLNNVDDTNNLQTDNMQNEMSNITAENNITRNAQTETSQSAENTNLASDDKNTSKEEEKAEKEDSSASDTESKEKSAKKNFVPIGVKPWMMAGVLCLILSVIVTPFMFAAIGFFSAGAGIHIYNEFEKSGIKDKFIKVGESKDDASKSEQLEKAKEFISEKRSELIEKYNGLLDEIANLKENQKNFPTDKQKKLISDKQAEQEKTLNEIEKTYLSEQEVDCEINKNNLGEKINAENAKLNEMVKQDKQATAEESKSVQNLEKQLAQQHQKLSITQQKTAEVANKLFINVKPLSQEEEQRLNAEYQQLQTDKKVQEENIDNLKSTLISTVKTNNENAERRKDVISEQQKIVDAHKADYITEQKKQDSLEELRQAVPVGHPFADTLARDGNGKIVDPNAETTKTLPESPKTEKISLDQLDGNNPPNKPSLNNQTNTHPTGFGSSQIGAGQPQIDGGQADHQLL